MLVDFHMHTNVSDGTYMPRDLVALAKEKHLQAISITDHDEVGAYAQLTAMIEQGFKSFMVASLVPITMKKKFMCWDISFP